MAQTTSGAGTWLRKRYDLEALVGPLRTLTISGREVLAVLFVGAHHRPDEMAWVVLFLLLIACGTMAFTGSLLPWTEQSLASARVASSAAEQVPLFGPFVRRSLLGGDRNGPVPLERIYGFHVALLPGIALLLLALLRAHLLGRQRASTTSDPPAAGYPLVPVLVQRVVVLSILSFMAIVVLGVLLPPSLGTAANELGPSRAGVFPPWYVLFAHEALRHAPWQVFGQRGVRLVVIAWGLVLVTGLVLPLFDRRGSRFVPRLALALLLVLAGLTGHVLLD